MAQAAKTPPQIAPGIKCPKCGGNMIDERQNKRTDKSPDYTCANLTCTDKTGKYRTAIWADKPTAQLSGLQKPAEVQPPILRNAEAEDAAELAGKIGDGREEAINALKAKHAFAMKHANEFVIKHIVPLYTTVEIGLTGDDCYKQAYTIFQTWEDKGLIE